MIFRLTHFISHFIILFFIASSCGCAHSGIRRPALQENTAGQKQVLSLPGAVVHSAVDPLTQLQTYGDDELFHLAREMNRQGHAAKARQVYQRLLDSFPASTYEEPALFNLALLYEGEKDFASAANLYRRIVHRPDAQNATLQGDELRTWLDAHFRLGVCYGKQSQWWRTVAVFDRVLALSWLNDDDRLEAMTGRGIAIQEAGEPLAAEVAFAGVVRFYREADRRGQVADKSLVAEAHFRMGDIAQGRYDEIELRFPVELLKTRLEEKCHELLSAQHRYIRALHFGDAHTVAAAGFRIGAMYESLYNAIVKLETPNELSDEQASVYHEEVVKRVGVLLEKALRVYEKAMKIGRTAYGPDEAAHGPWLKKLSQGIERLRSLVLAQATPA